MVNCSPFLRNWGICALRGKFEKMPIFAIFCGLLEFGGTWGNFAVIKVKRGDLQIFPRVFGGTWGCFGQCLTENTCPTTDLT